MEDGLKVSDNGTKCWYLNGRLHRSDGPAIEHMDGSTHWLLNGVTHRENGPAVIHANGNKMWYINGNLHREDGPAIEFSDSFKHSIEFSDSIKHYYYHGKYINASSNEEFLRLIKLKSFW